MQDGRPRAQAGSAVSSAVNIHLSCTQSLFINPTNPAVTEAVFPLAASLPRRPLIAAPRIQGSAPRGAWVPGAGLLLNKCRLGT